MKKNYPVTNRELDYPADAIILSTTDLKGRITYCNQDFLDISGFNEDELYGKAHNTVRHPDMPPLAFADLWNHLKSHKAWMGLVKNRCKNGDHYWVNAFAMPIMENGSVTEYQSVRTKPEPHLVRRAERIYAGLMAEKIPLAVRLPALNTTPRLLTGFGLALAAPVGLLIYSGAAPLDIALATAASGGIAGGFILALGRRIQRLARQSRKIVDNKLMQYIYTNSTDDVGQLEFALQMREAELNAVLGRSLDNAGMVKNTAEQLDNTMEKTTQAVQQQQIEIEQVATAMNEMSATVRDVAANTANAASAADESSESTRNGQLIVQSVVGSIRDLAGEVQRTTNTITELHAQSSEIDSILDVIRNIAEQTNLLALNAAIEAARAGEQGRGFAVVADEVRTLAQRTQESTREIEEMIAGFRNAADQAVQAMTHSMELSENGVNHAAEADTALADIEKAVNIIRDRMNQIATAAEEQSAVAEEINSNVNSISASAITTTRDVNQTQHIGQELLQGALRQERLMAQFRNHP